MSIWYLDGGNSKIFYFHPYQGRWFKFDEHIFQMDWNHQLGIYCLHLSHKNQPFMWENIYQSHGFFLGTKLFGKFSPGNLTRGTAVVCSASEDLRTTVPLALDRGSTVKNDGRSLCGRKTKCGFLVDWTNKTEKNMIYNIYIVVSRFRIYFFERNVQSCIIYCLLDCTALCIYGSILGSSHFGSVVFLGEFPASLRLRVLCIVSARR